MNKLTRLYRRLFGLDFPDPVVGQIWRSSHSGRCLRVHSVSVMDNGVICWSVTRHDPDTQFPPMPEPHDCGLDSWRRLLRREARVLVGFDDPWRYRGKGRSPVSENVTKAGA